MRALPAIASRPSRLAAAAVVAVLAVACTRTPGDDPPTSPSEAASSPAPSGSSDPSTAPVVLILLENHEASEIVGSSDAPFLNDHLIPTGRLLTNYAAVAHPSLPNYLAMTSGDTLGKTGTDDIRAGELSSDNLFHQLSSAGIDWRAYQETMPSPCYRGTEAGSEPGNYALKHDPAMTYANIAETDLCEQVVPFTSFEPSSLPTFSFVTPNQCNDMHSCDIATGDRWLQTHVPSLLSAGAIVVITFDEGSSDANGGGHVMLLELGPGIPAGVRDGSSFDHYSLLAALEDRYEVPRLGAAASATPLPL
jgi:acid phosphatase